MGDRSRSLRSDHGLLQGNCFSAFIGLCDSKNCAALPAHRSTRPGLESAMDQREPPRSVLPCCRVTIPALLYVRNATSRHAICEPRHHIFGWRAPLLHKTGLAGLVFGVCVSEEGLSNPAAPVSSSI